MRWYRSMLRCLIPLAVALVTIPAGRADACSMAFVDLFTNYEQATIVARVEVTAITTQGQVALERKATLKGDKASTLTGVQGGMCPPTYEVKQDVIGFFDQAGVATWIEGNPKLVTDAVKRWRGAKSDAARRKVLRALAKSKNAVLRMHAVERIRREDAAAASATTTAAWAGADPKWKSPGTEKAAAARITTLWPAIIAAVPSGLGRFDDAMKQRTCTLSATTITATEAARRVRDTMGTTDPSLLGTLAALDALGSEALWNTGCSVAFWTLQAYLRSRTGELVMLWVPPEG